MKLQPVHAKAAHHSEEGNDGSQQHVARQPSGLSPSRSEQGVDDDSGAQRYSQGERGWVVRWC